MNINCQNCDKDQEDLCRDCPNKINVERLILATTDINSSLESIARRALSCSRSKNILFLAQQLAAIADALSEHPSITNIANHPIIQWMAILIKNRCCPNPDFTFGRLLLMVEDLANLTE